MQLIDSEWVKRNQPEKAPLWTDITGRGLLRRLLFLKTKNYLTYHTLHTLSLSFTMGWPALQENAWANSGMLTTTPLIL